MLLASLTCCNHEIYKFLSMYSFLYTHIRGGHYIVYCSAEKAYELIAITTTTVDWLGQPLKALKRRQSN